jgi:hypothetical protein
MKKLPTRMAENSGAFGGPENFELGHRANSGR